MTTPLAESDAPVEPVKEPGPLVRADTESPSRMRAVALRLLRSAAGGGVATVVDLCTLTTLVSVFGVAPRAASVPALLLGAITMFVTQKLFAFRSSGGPVLGELIRFALVQAATLALNA